MHNTYIFDDIVRDLATIYHLAYLFHVYQRDSIHFFFCKTIFISLSYQLCIGVLVYPTLIFIIEYVILRSFVYKQGVVLYKLCNHKPHKYVVSYDVLIIFVHRNTVFWHIRYFGCGGMLMVVTAVQY